MGLNCLVPLLYSHELERVAFEYALSGGLNSTLGPPVMGLAIG